MAHIICTNTSSFLVRCLPQPTRALFIPAAHHIGPCHLVNKGTYCNLHQFNTPSYMHTMHNFDLCRKATLLKTNSFYLDCSFKMKLSVATSSFPMNKSFCWKNLHTRTSNFGPETDNDKQVTDEANSINLESCNVSPEVNKLQETPSSQTSIELATTVTHTTEMPVSIDAFLSESDDDLDILVEQEKPAPIEEYVEPPLVPASYTLASYIEQSEVLQKLVHLGVDLSKVERRPGVGEKLLKMNFDPDISEKISFLHFVGVESDNLGKFLTKNPLILLEDQENLEKRVEYLMSKKFDQKAIAQIVNRAPYILCFSVERLDNRLGFYQRTFNLTGDELRQIVTACPMLVTQSLEKTKEIMFVLRKQFGFYQEEMKLLVISHPRILTRGKYKLICVFDYLHNDMGISHKLILKNYQVFNSRAFQIQERHKFLESIGRAQYDPNQPGYVSLKRMVTLPDDAFCVELAKSTLEEYNSFLKTL